MKPFPRFATALLLFLLSGVARADDAAPAGPHWSGLPIWGAEAEARGYRLPLPFGIGITGFSAKQPVNIQDLQIGRNGLPPTSIKNFIQIDQYGPRTNPICSPMSFGEPTRRFRRYS